jgi:hypothetical protein
VFIVFTDGLTCGSSRLSTANHRQSLSSKRHHYFLEVTLYLKGSLSSPSAASLQHTLQQNIMNYNKFSEQFSQETLVAAQLCSKEDNKHLQVSSPVHPFRVTFRTNQRQDSFDEVTSSARKTSLFLLRHHHQASFMARDICSLTSFTSVYCYRRISLSLPLL